MGRLEPLTVLALGRSPYEDEVIQTSDGGSSHGAQQYNEKGSPYNPETKRREREHVRAANEVMQVTGIVEDTIAARLKANEDIINKNQETLTGLRLMEAGRYGLVGGVWGVLGLRRRILLYRPYSEIPLIEVLRKETAVHSISHLLFSGIPTVIAYHLSDWVAFFAETLIETVFEDDDGDAPSKRENLKNFFQGAVDVGFCYLTLHFRMFAILQQLNLIPSSRLLPSLRSFIPFSTHSPLQLPPPPSPSAMSLVSYATALLRTAAPMLIILAHGKLKFAVSRIIYRPIYKALPRPTGDSMFSGLPITAPSMEYDAPDRDRRSDESGLYRGEDEPTLRALEGLPTLERTDTRSRRSETGGGTTDDEDGEMAQATLISFDVEATEAVEPSLGMWSAELRSANGPRPPEDAKYRVTGLTMLPPIMATEGLREVAAGIVVLPLEALMVRMIGSAYRTSGGMAIDDLFPNSFSLKGVSFGNIFSAFNIQLAVTGVVWAGFTLGAQWYAMREREKLEENSENENPTN